MLNRILIGALALVLAAVIAGTGWYYRPWSPYSPASIRAMDDPDAYPQTFQRLDSILPSRPIAATAPAPLPRAVTPLEVSYAWMGEEKRLETYLEEAGVIGLTVLHDGVVTAQEFRLGADSGTRFTSWSVAKTVVAVLIAKAMEDGLIDSLDDPAGQYAPQFAGTDYGAVSLRHLLMMSAGVDFNEEYSPERPSDVRPLFSMPSFWGAMWMRWSARSPAIARPARTCIMSAPTPMCCLRWCARCIARRWLRSSSANCGHRWA